SCFSLSLHDALPICVRPLSAVVSPEGLVGLVASVDEHTSIVLSWAHPEFRASAIATDGSIVGIAAPHGAEGPKVWLLELQGVLRSEEHTSELQSLTN